jgi:single-strand DNA-binding protein
MSEGLNKVILIGNLGAEPELRRTQGGHVVLHFRLATSESYWDKEKSKQERTEWHSVKVWGRRGETLVNQLGKGSRVAVFGRLHTSSYEKQGQKHYRTEVVADDVLCSDVSRSDVSRSNGAFARPPAPEATTADFDVPF